MGVTRAPVVGIGLGAGVDKAGLETPCVVGHAGHAMTRDRAAPSPIPRCYRDRRVIERKRSWKIAARAAFEPHAPCTPPPGMRARRREVKVAYRRLGAAEPGDRAEHELLVQLRGAAVDRAADEVAVVALEVGRAHHRAAADQRLEARARAPRCAPASGRRTRSANDASSNGAASSPAASPLIVARQVRVRPQRLLARAACASGRSSTADRRAGTAAPGRGPARSARSSSVSASTLSTMCSVPARRASGAVHGTGASRSSRP